jgi:hypothetical protein
MFPLKMVYITLFSHCRYMHSQTACLHMEPRFFPFVATAPKPDYNLHALPSASEERYLRTFH